MLAPLDVPLLPCSMESLAAASPLEDSSGTAPRFPTLLLSATVRAVTLPPITRRAELHLGAAGIASAVKYPVRVQRRSKNGAAFWTRRRETATLAACCVREHRSTRGLEL